MRLAWILLALASCAAPPLPEASAPPWDIHQRQATGYFAGTARLGGGSMIGFRSRSLPPSRILHVEEERTRARVGAVVRVHVRIDPHAKAGPYRVIAASDAEFIGGSELLLEPGEQGAFRLVSDRPGLARIRVTLQETLDVVDSPSRRSD